MKRFMYESSRDDQIQDALTGCEDDRGINEKELDQRLRQAARVLAEGAIRSTMVADGGEISN